MLKGSSSFNKMRIMHLKLSLFLIWCQAAETSTDQVTDLGQNETINCDLDIVEVAWMLLKLPDPPVLILKSFSNPPNTFYVNKTFRQKYSVQSNHLIIHNITADDSGVYYCSNMETTIKFSAGTRLQIMAPTDFPASTEYQNHTEVKCFQQNQTVVKDIQQNQTPWKTISIISGLLNAFLVVVLIGLLKVFILGNETTRSKTSQKHHSTDQQQRQVQPQEPNVPQYAEVNFSQTCKQLRQNQHQSSTYAALKLPQ